jgi:O-antigen ligase
MVLVVPWILLTLLTEQRHVVRAVLWLVAGAALCAAGAVVQVLFNDVIPGGAITGDSRLTGFTGHVSDLGGIMAMGVGAALGATFSPLPRRHRRVAESVLVLAATGLLLSGSVSGMLAVLAVALFLVVQGAIRVRRVVLLGIVGAGAGVLAMSLLAGVGARNPVERFLVTTGKTSVGGESNTAGSRFELAARALDGIAEHPLTGHGLVVPDNVLLRTLSVHNNFLAAWHGGGILLLVGVVIVTVIAVRYCFVWDPSDPLHMTVASAVVAALAFAQTAPSFYNRYYWLPVAFAVMLAVRARSGWPAALRGEEAATSPRRAAVGRGV